MNNKIRGQRANDIIVDDFCPLPVSCSGIILEGFAPIYEVKYINCKGCVANIDNIKPCEYCGRINNDT